MPIELQAGRLPARKPLVGGPIQGVAPQRLQILMAQQGQAKTAWQQEVLPKPTQVIQDEIPHLSSVQAAADRATEAVIRQQKGKDDTGHR